MHTRGFSPSIRVCGRLKFLNFASESFAQNLLRPDLFLDAGKLPLKCAERSSVPLFFFFEQKNIF